MTVLTYKDSEFLLDSKPYVVISGAMHYFRIPDEYWHDRLLKLKECGFNTVETYTSWNLHEPKEGEFDFSGNLDIEKFIRTAAELGLNVILRPGPYICAEWDLGGLPSWLLTYDKIDLRCYDEVYLSKVRRYYNELLGRIRPYLASNGGNIFMMQVENEYGSYGNDKKYMREVAKIYKENDIDCLLFTSDGPDKSMLGGGTLDEYICVANFGSNPKKNLEFLNEFRPNQPSMCGEYWCGWFDHWFEEHHVRPSDEVTEDVKTFMKMGASFNFYMFHGGTNFGFTNGANYDGKYQPTITSYDYNAPLNEAGDRTELYYKIRDIIKACHPVPELTAKETEKKAYGKVKLTENAGLFENIENISKPVFSSGLKYMEEIGQDFGYILYRTTRKGPANDLPLKIDVVHDRAQIFINGENRYTAERWNRPDGAKTDIRLPLEKGEEVKLDILVENMGRVNYGSKLLDRKGIHGLRFSEQTHFGWEIYSLPMKDLSGLKFKKSETEEAKGPVFLRGTLNITDTPNDTFVRLDGFTKGFVMINGINIGRYFNPAGPQKTLYVPAPFLRQGDNEIVVFESDGTKSMEIEFFDTPDLG